MTPTRCFCGQPLSAGPDLPGIDAVHCPGCGYWHTTFRVGNDRQALQSGAHETAFQGQDGRRFGSVVGTVRALCARFRARRARLSAPAGTATHVVDFGCGQGYFLDALRDTGHRCSGIEISEITARTAMAKGHAVAHSLDALAGDRANAVASVHVLEHLPDPDAILAALRQQLPADARVYFEVPNFGSLQAVWFRERWLHCEAGLHVHHFTPASFAGLLARHGVAVEDVGTYSFEHGLLGWVQSLLNLAFPYNRFFRRVVLNRPLADKLTCWPELLLMPLLVPLGLVLLAGEAALGRGAVLRVRGRFSAAERTPPAGRS